MWVSVGGTVEWELVSCFQRPSLMLHRWLAGCPQQPCRSVPGSHCGVEHSLAPVALPLALPRLLAAEGKSCSVSRDCSEPTTVAKGSRGVVLRGLTRHPPGRAPG